MRTICLLEDGVDGHRSEYTQLFVKALPLISAKVCTAAPGESIPENCDSILIPMIEGNYDRLLKSVARGFFGGPRTVGLLFRPKEAIEGLSSRHLLKRLFLRIVSHLPNVRIVTILPFDIEPAFAKLASGWIYDPQMWDLTLLERPIAPNSDLFLRVKETANGRPVVVSLGAQNTGKGFDYFTKIWCDSSIIRSRFLFVAAGQVASKSKTLAGEFQSNGGCLLDRHLEPFELFSLYEIANLVWSCYSPTYDQASGIYGRALQLGRPVAVREGSYLARLSQQLNHEVVPIRFEDTAYATQALLSASSLVSAPSPTVIAPQAYELRRRSLSGLRNAFGIEE